MPSQSERAVDPARSMKPLLGKVIDEAVRMAVADCIPPEARAMFDEDALGQEIALRLLGPGGWMVGDCYAGNATAREVFDQSFDRPDRSIVSEVAFDLMCDMQAAHEPKCAACDVPIRDGENVHECPADDEEGERCKRCGGAPIFGVREDDGIVCLKCASRDGHNAV